MGMTAFELFGVLKLDKSDFDRGLTAAKSAGSIFGKGLATAAGVGIAAVGAAATAVAGFGAMAIRTGSQFDTAMGGVAATLGQTVDEMDAEVGKVDTSFGHFEGTLREFAMFMGQNTVFSASQAADALNYMALAGYKTQESMEMLPAVLDMAAAGAMDLATASDMITDTQRALGLSFERTNQMVDEFAKAASTGNTNVEQLGEAFLRVGGLAAELNGGMVKLSDGTEAATDGTQELEIAFTAMANAGIKGSEAGTHMRNMLLKLSSPTEDGAKALEAMGVAIFDDEGKMRSLSDVFSDLSTVMGQMTQEQRMKTISDLFNTRDMASAEALLSAVNQDWDHIGESILDAEGAATQMAATKLDNLAGDTTLFKSALETAQITINDQLSPTLREFVQLGTQGLQDITSAFNEGGLSGAMEAFGTVLSDALNMILAKAPDLVAAGLQLLSAFGQGIVDNAPVLFNAILQIGGQLGDAVIGLMEKAATAIGDFDWAKTAGDIAEFLKNALTGEGATRFLDAAMEIISGLVAGLGEALPELIPAAIEIILSLVEYLIDNIDKLIDAAITLITGLADGLIQALPILIEKAPIIVEKLMTALITNAPKIVKAAGEIIIKLVGGIITNLPQIFSAANRIGDTLIKGIVSFFGQMSQTGKEMIGRFRDAIKSFDFASWGRDMIDSFVNGIKGRIGAVRDAVGSIASTVRSVLHFSEPDVGPLADFHTYAPDMMNLFIKGIKDNESALQSAVENAFDFKDMMMSNVESSAGLATNANVSNGNTTVNLTIYGAQGQDVRELADIISERINATTNRQLVAVGMA